MPNTSAVVQKLWDRRVISNYEDAVNELTALKKQTKIDEDELPEEKSHENVKTKWDLGKYAAYYFLTGGAPAMLTSYLPVYYRQLGLDPHQIGVIQSLQPWVSIPSIPVWGYIADRFNATRAILVFTLFVYLLGNVALLFTPKAEKEDCETVLSRVCHEDEFECSTEFISQKVGYLLEEEIHDLGVRKRNCTRGKCIPNEESSSYLFVEKDLYWLFIYIVLVNLIGTTFHAPSMALCNSALLNFLTKEKRNQYGYFRAAGAVSTAIGLVVAGIAVDQTEEMYTYCGIDLTHANYSVCFIGFAVCIIAVLPIAWTLPIPEQNYDKSQPYHFGEVFQVLCTFRYGNAFLAITWLSVTIGVAKTFDFWYIKTIGGSYSIIAWTGMLSTLTQLATFLGLPLLNDRFGHLSFLILALFMTAAGCFISGVISNPWLMIIPMCFRGIATATACQSAGAYLANAVDKDHMATMQSIMSAAIEGVGNGAGSLLGGILIRNWSAFICYTVFAITSVVFTFVLIVIWCFEKCNRAELEKNKL